MTKSVFNIQIPAFAIFFFCYLRYLKYICRDENQKKEPLKTEKPLILVSNDDGAESKGLEILINIAREFGDVVVAAPIEARSGMSHAITINTPVRAEKIREEEDLAVYRTNGTPVDSVKLAINQLLPRKPDFLFSGVNHGSNAAISVIYSGTMGAAIEGCLNRIPSAGFSLTNHDSDADFTASELYIRKIVENIIRSGLPEDTCLNVNIPVATPEEIRGVKVCRQTRGVWKEEYDRRTDPGNKTYYWLTGFFNNYEAAAEDTDEWALKNNYVAVVPVHIDFTAYKALEHLKTWNYEI